jgi:hypothetical protein
MSDLDRERRERLFAVALPLVAVAAIAGLSVFTSNPLAWAERERFPERRMSGAGRALSIGP